MGWTRILKKMMYAGALLLSTEQNGTTMEPSIQVLIAEDGGRARAAVRALLSSWPEFEIVGEVATGQEAIDFVATQRTDVVLMDIEMPGMDGLEATRQIKSRWPEIGVVILTMYHAYLNAALMAGADAFFSKDEHPDEWLTALRTTATRRMS